MHEDQLDKQVRQVLALLVQQDQPDRKVQLVTKDLKVYKVRLALRGQQDLVG